MTASAPSTTRWPGSAPAVAHLRSERRDHRVQELHPLPDGRCRVTSDAAGLPDLAAWVASFGGHLRALQPPELVEMVRGVHRAGLATHGEAMTPEVVSPDDNKTWDSHQEGD